MNEERSQKFLRSLKRSTYKSGRNKNVVNSVMNTVHYPEKEKNNCPLPNASEKEVVRAPLKFKDVSLGISIEIAEIKKKNDRLRKRANCVKYIVLICLTLIYLGVFSYHGKICYSK